MCSNRRTIAGIRNYSGDPGIALDERVVEDAIARLAGPAAYGIDFGVLETGETALVELNDGFSLGSYGLDPALYTDLIVTRWEELPG